MQQCGLKNIRIQFEDSVSFDPITDSEEVQYANFVDDGPAKGLAIDLAICEYDPNLISNFNFRHPDALKMNITTSGLEEMRAALTY